MRDDLDIPFPGQTAALSDGFGRTGYGTRQSGLDPNTKRMAIIAGGIGGALLLLVGVWSAVAPHRAGVPVIEADARPVREKPVNKGGLNVVGADESSLGAEAEGKAVVAPEPESPALAALKATPPAPVAEPVKPAVVASVPAEPAKTVSPPAAAKEVPPAALIATPKAIAPASASAAQRVALTPNAPTPNALTPVATAPAVPHPAAVAAGGAQVQLAAVGTEQAAQSEWQRLSHKYPELLGSRHLAMSHVDRDGKTFWRVRTGGFADAAAATAFCAQVKAKGAACSVASF